MDGWLLRYLPGKARRARCINAVAPGRVPLAQKLALAAEVYRQADLPMIFRLTPFTQPADLDGGLQELGYFLVDPTWVMVSTSIPKRPSPDLPAGTHWARLDALHFAEVVGALRGSPAEHRSSHALRLQNSPIPYQGYAIRRDTDAVVLACGQFALEADLVGLYDVFTLESARGKGLSSILCERMLSESAKQGAQKAYLQVDAENEAAMKVYRRLGFSPAYQYHYRQSELQSN
jgi:GNAT superfamily N-acetyltransferase